MVRGHSARDAWLLAIAVGTALASGCALGPRWGPDATAMDVRRPSDGEWFGIYLGARKVGAYHSVVKVEERDGISVLVVRTDTTMAADVGDREVKAAGEWVALDPELGQAVADATHVKFAVGEWSTEAVSVFGAVEVLSARAQ